MKSFQANWLKAIEQRIAQYPGGRVVISPDLSMNMHKLQAGKKHAAVFVPLCNRHGEASFLFNVRTHLVGTHRGQVSFPGGHIEASETAIEAALREMEEELGIARHQVRVLGIAQTIPAITGTLVTPVIGFIDTDVGDFEHLRPNTQEVHSVFSRTFSRLTTPEERTTEILNRTGKPVVMPAFGAKGDPERIWGLTAKILDSILFNVVVPAEPTSLSPSPFSLAGDSN